MPKLCTDVGQLNLGRAWGVTHDFAHLRAFARHIDRIRRPAPPWPRNLVHLWWVSRVARRIEGVLEDGHLHPATHGIQ